MNKGQEINRQRFDRASTWFPFCHDPVFTGIFGTGVGGGNESNRH